VLGPLQADFKHGAGAAGQLGDGTNTSTDPTMSPLVDLANAGVGLAQSDLANVGGIAALIGKETSQGGMATPDDHTQSAGAPLSPDQHPGLSPLLPPRHDH
jgi:hypothetical protein